MASAGVACAAEDGGNCDYNFWDDMYGVAGSNYYDSMGGYAGSNYQDIYGVADYNNTTNMTNMTNSTTNMTNITAGNNTSSQIIPPDFNHRDPAAGEPVHKEDTAKAVHTVNSTGNATGQQKHNATANASGEPVHNVTGNATHNITAKATNSHKMLATGNPILALFAISAVLGGVAVLRKK